MIEKFASVFLLSLIYVNVYSQKKIEHLKIDWPAEYNWKVANSNSDKFTRSVMIIPGSETAETASLIGTMIAHIGSQSFHINEVISHYQSGLDSGSQLTVLGHNSDTKPEWILFKVETAKTDKYPEPESDLYYVLHGQYAIYENYVAVKKPSLSDEFIKKWSEIFKNGKLVIE